MSEFEDVHLKIINSIYLTLSRASGAIPFGGGHYLEEITRGVGDEILKGYGERFNTESRKPSDICKAYLNALGHLEFVEKGFFQLEDKGDSVLATMSQEQCFYQDFCRKAHEERLLFYCPRLGAFQAVLKKVLGVEYSTEVDYEPTSGVCRGRIFPVKHRLRTEMVQFVDDTLDIAGERAILFTKDVYLSFLVAVNEYAPFILKKVLFDTGYRSFLVVAREAKKCYQKPEDLLRVCFEEMKSCGFGRIELVSLETAAGHAVVRCYQSFEVAVVKDIDLYRTPRVACNLLRGMLSACLTEILGHQIICEEMQCAAVKGEYCEFCAYPEDENGGE
ncbi:MAG: V4R domain-containing protein [Syntrophaceticus sp.]